MPDPTTAAAAPRTPDSAPDRGAAPRRRSLKPLAVLALVLLLGGVAGWQWWQDRQQALPAGIAKANGRLETEQIEIATKLAGRIAELPVAEGQMVEAGALVARMETTELEAQLRAARAQVRRAQSEKLQAEALIGQRESELAFARQELERTRTLQSGGYAPVAKLDERRTLLRSAQAARDTAVASQEAAVASIAALEAEAARLQSLIDDSRLVAPRRGRVQYKLAQPGEVLGAGGRVVTLLDIGQIYMTVFLPARAAGRLTLGDEARIVLDPVPQWVIPARVAFVAADAQFTPKTVETAEEREKLMFRAKLAIAPELLQRYEDRAKTGVRGVGFVRTDPAQPWPEALAVKLP